MNVKVKDWGILMEIKNKGAELEIRTPGGKFLGDLVVTKSGLTWCPGRVDRRNGKRVTWDEFIEHMESR